MPWKPAVNLCCCYLQPYSYSSIVQGCDLICCWLPLAVGRVNCVCGGWDGSGAVADLAEENDNYSVAGGVKELAFYGCAKMTEIVLFPLNPNLCTRITSFSAQTRRKAKEMKKLTEFYSLYPLKKCFSFFSIHISKQRKLHFAHFS